MPGFSTPSGYTATVRGGAKGRILGQDVPTLPHSKTPSYRDLAIAFFDSVAPEYDSWAGGLHARVAGRLAELADPQPGQSVLDVGTGTGLVALQLGRSVGRRGQVVGVDLSEKMLAVARWRSLRNTRLLAMDADRLVFRDASFDLVTFGDVLGYLDDPLVSLEEARRILRPEGRIAISVRRRSLNTEAQEVFYRLLDELIPELPLTIPLSHPDLERLGETESITELLDTAGFGEPQLMTMVTGARLEGPASWVGLMRGAGPRPHALIGTMGPALRQQFEHFVGREMAKLGEDAFHYHEAFTFATARAPG